MSAYAVSSRGLAAHKVPQGVLATIMEMLYSNSEQGIAKLDFSDFTGMYQDRARTIPYTAVEQPLGSFTGLNGVTATAPADVNRGKVSARVNTFSTTQAVSNGTVTAIPDAFGPGFDGLQITRTSSTDEVYLPINPSDVRGGSTYTLKMHLKKGGHTNSSQYCSFYTSAGYCAFTVTWASGAISYGAVAGGFTITNHSSVQLSADSYYVTLDCAVPAGVTSVTFARIYLWAGGQGVPSSIIGNPQFSLAADAHLPYQWVNTPTDYDTVGFPRYLAFNGTNTAYVTPSIDFTGTDKMTVWAGVTKLSDAAVAVVAELGTAIPPGGFYMAAPNSVGPTFGFASKGTVQASPTPLGHAAPKNAVLTGIGDISGDIASLRVNGVATTANTDQGTGNYGNYPLYIGARAGTVLFFNGRIYSLIVRGAQSSLSQIEATELYIKRKMRLP